MYFISTAVTQLVTLEPEVVGQVLCHRMVARCNADALALPSPSGVGVSSSALAATEAGWE